MSDLLEKLKLGSQNSKLVDWPGTKEKVRMRIANEYDMSLATVEADRFFKERTIGTPNLQAYLDYKKAYRLYLMLSDPSTDQPIAPTFNQFHPLLTQDIQDDLETQSNVFQDECSPDPDLLTPDQLKAQYQEVKKNGYMAVISLIGNINIERQLGAFMASLLLDLQGDN